MPAFSLAVDVGTFTLNGLAVITSRGRKLAVGAGELLVYSQSVVLQRGKSVPAAVGAFVLAGQDVALERRQNVARGAFTFSGKAVNFIAPGAVTYATIVNGIVTSIDSGALLPSTDTTIYFDLTGVSPLPEIGYYFSEVCQTFSATPPAVPPGDIAPPFVPGGEPPVITDPGGNGPDGPDEPGPVPLAFTIPVLIPFHAVGPLTGVPHP